MLCPYVKLCMLMCGFSTAEIGVHHCNAFTSFISHCDTWSSGVWLQGLGPVFLSVAVIAGLSLQLSGLAWMGNTIYVFCRAVFSAVCLDLNQKY